MNVSNADYFTFNVDNSLLLVGQTGTGKSVLQDRLIDRLLLAYTPDEIKFVLLDLTGVDFSAFRGKHEDYVLVHLDIAPALSIQALEELADLSGTRIKARSTNPLIYIFIEECDIAVQFADRFRTAVMTINRNAKAAGMKLVFSTSRPGPDVIPKELLHSFDLVLAGTLSDVDYEWLEVGGPLRLERWEFVVSEGKAANR